MENFCTYIAQKAQSRKDDIFFRTDAPAETAISWAAFYHEVNAAANFLLSCHIQQNDKIVCLLSLPLAWLKLFFAALQIGAVPVLANFRDKFHVQSILENCPFSICMDDEIQAQGIVAPSSKTILFKETPLSSSLEQDGPVLRNDDDLFCALYTSGSVGKPKYVEKTYRNILAELQFLKELLQIREDDVVLVLVPHIHIYGLLFGLLLPAMTGAQIVFTDKLFPREVIQISRKREVNYLIGAPLHYQVFLETEIHSMKMSHLKFAISSGAPLPDSIAHEFLRQTGVTILELYGSTETGGIAYRFWEATKSSPFFQFFPYMQKKIAHAGEIVELAIHSPAISSNIFSASSDAWYHTGDFIQFAENSLEKFRIVGRQEQIMKVGGRRIATTQLEEELKTIHGIKDVAVIRVDGTTLHRESGVAFVELGENVNLSQADIQKEFQKISANFRAICDIFILEKIPRNQSGKIIYNDLKSLIPKKL
jgi:acyl-coenzyme A synthetase/AMP-(fatty) acid ligase